MANVNARLKIKGKEFEILVDLDKALMFRKTGQGSIQNFLAFNEVFSDIKKGMHASTTDLKACFGTDDIEKIAAEIVRKGEIQVSSEHRKEERDAKIKQVIDFIAKNYIDPKTGKPHTPTRVETAFHEAHINISDMKSVQEQLPEIIKEMQKFLPLKTEVKKLQITVPAVYTGSVYALLHGIKEKEEWLNDGSLLAVVNLPTGMQSEFYDKLNKMTHGSALTAELNEKE
ncbi:ribosome assembly factor SBDS [Candidatus Pacearchaeota archaeon]|nr:ribosome assembly factor SBDS [Candidatus Pacearchaeota archaeon]